MMTKIFYKLSLAFALLFFSGCDMIEYHPYYVDIDGENGLTQKNVDLIEQQCKGKDTIRIVHISDTQRFYDETEAMVNSINLLENIDFVIHTGDQTDFGLPKEYSWQRAILTRLKVPYVCAIGNHDCLGSGEHAYHYMYGKDNFSLNASFLHVVSLNTNAYEYDYSDDVPNFGYIKQDIETLPDSISSTLIAMHVAPGMFLFNDNIAEYFNYVTLQYPDLKCCICGHDHRFEVLHPFGDEGPAYIQCEDAKSKSYIIYTITRNSLDYEVVRL